VFALMGWRAGPMWRALGLGFVALGIADAIYSVDVLSHSYRADTGFDAVWLAGSMVIAYAAWLPHPGELAPVTVSGWKAIALPLSAQVLAVTLQIYGLFAEVPRSERILTVVVLFIAMVQIVVTRPRDARGQASSRPV